MQSLSLNWITEGTFDFEYKKYLLLAYLQHVRKNFNENKLYPFLAELVTHYRHLVEWKDKKQRVEERMPKKLKEIDLEAFTLAYERMVEDDEYLEIVNEIVNFAIPQIKREMESGKSIYDFVEEKLSITPVGIMPLDASAGLFFLYKANTHSAKLFTYEVSIYSASTEKYRSLRTSWKGNYAKTNVETFESLKHRAIRDLSIQYVPATFLIHCEVTVPTAPTLLPVAKRTLMRYLATA